MPSRPIIHIDVSSPTPLFVSSFPFSPYGLVFLYPWLPTIFFVPFRPFPFPSSFLSLWPSSTLALTSLSSLVLFGHFLTSHLISLTCPALSPLVDSAPYVPPSFPSSPIFSVHSRTPTHLSPTAGLYSSLQTFLVNSTLAQLGKISTLVHRSPSNSIFTIFLWCFALPTCYLPYLHTDLPRCLGRIYHTPSPRHLS